jgi:hypothetical protein
MQYLAPGLPGDFRLHVGQPSASLEGVGGFGGEAATGFGGAIGTGGFGGATGLGGEAACGFGGCEAASGLGIGDACGFAGGGE